MHKCVLFDMDGTLVDTYQGIYHSYVYAAEQMGIEFPGKEFVGKAIGAPLMSVFTDLLFLTQNEAQNAAEHYRRYYAEKGKHEAVVYDGIPESLSELKKQGCILGVATLKSEVFAKEILHELGLDIYFDVVCGIDENDKLTKAELIEKCILQVHVNKNETVLVGDSEYDYEGAQMAGVDFLAVTYGFGFHNIEFFNEHNILHIAHDRKEMASILLDGKGY